MRTIIFYSNLAPHYRRRLWLRFLELKELHFSFYYGDNGKTGIKEIDFTETEFEEFKNNIYRTKNYWIYNKAIIWQSGVIKSCFSDIMHIAIFTGDMYCISTWIAAILCRLRKVKVVFWGHGIYGNEGFIKSFFRICFYRIANKHLLYSDHSKRIMIENGFKSENLYVIFNSLDYEKHNELRTKFNGIKKEEVFSFFANPQLPVLIFIGRLTHEKKIEQLINVLNEINGTETKLNLLIIGGGDEKENLSKLGENGILKKCLFFTGALYDEEINGKYLYCADLCVSPGNVGLTAVHSLSFGTPVSTHSNLNNQGPEAEAIIDGYNGFYFEENNIDDLKIKIENWLTTNTNREKVRERCYEIIDNYYNPKYQLKVFNCLLNDENPEI